MVIAPSRAERSRSKLLAAANAALVAGDGGFELQDVAARSGVSVGLVSHHFGSKAGLIAAVVNIFYDEAEQALDLHDFAQGGWSAREQERLARLIDFLYREETATVILSKLVHYPDVAAIETRRWNGLIDAAARNIIKGQARGQISSMQSPDIMAAMIVGAARHAIVQALTSAERPTKAQLGAAIWSFITSGLRLQAGKDIVVPFPARTSANQTREDSGNEQG